MITYYIILYLLWVTVVHCLTPGLAATKGVNASAVGTKSPQSLLPPGQDNVQKNNTVHPEVRSPQLSQKLPGGLGSGTPGKNFVSHRPLSIPPAVRSPQPLQKLPGGVPLSPPGQGSVSHRPPQGGRQATGGSQLPNGGTKHPSFINGPSARQKSLWHQSMGATPHMVQPSGPINPVQIPAQTNSSNAVGLSGVPVQQPASVGLPGVPVQQPASVGIPGVPVQQPASVGLPGVPVQQPASVGLPGVPVQQPASVGIPGVPVQQPASVGISGVPVQQPASVGLSGVPVQQPASVGLSGVPVQQPASVGISGVPVQQPATVGLSGVSVQQPATPTVSRGGDKKEYEESAESRYAGSISPEDEIEEDMDMMDIGDETMAPAVATKESQKTTTSSESTQMPESDLKTEKPKSSSMKYILYAIIGLMWINWLVLLILLILRPNNGKKKKKGKKGKDKEKKKDNKNVKPGSPYGVA